MIPLLPVVPLTRHFYPPLTRAPSPRGYGLRLMQPESFYLQVFNPLNLIALPPFNSLPKEEMQIAAITP